MELVSKVTLSFMGLTPSSSFGILREKATASCSACAKVLADTVTLGRCSEASKTRKVGKDNGINVPLSPGLHCRRAFPPQYLASANASARSTDRLIHYTASSRPFLPAPYLGPSQQGGRCRSSIAYCMHSRKKQSNTPWQCTPRGRGFTNPKAQAPI